MKRALVTAGLVLTMLASCGGGEEGWGEEARTEFVAGCVDGGAEREVCECLQEKLEAANPDLEDPADLDQGEVVEFTKECIE